MKKICLDIRPLETSHRFRGIGYYVFNLVENILKQDKENEYFLLCGNPKKNDLIAKWQAKSRLRIIEGPLLGKSYWRYFLGNQYFLFGLLKKNKFDIYLSLDFSPPLFWPPKVKIITIVHDLIPQLFSRFEKLSRGKKLENFLKSKILKKLYLIVAVSKNTKKDLIRLYRINPAKIKVIYEAADARFVLLTEPERVKIRKKFAAGSRYLLYAGDLADPRKNVLFSIKVFQRLVNDVRFKNYKFLLVGGQGAKNAYFYQIKNYVLKNKLTDKIIFTGFVPDREIGKVFAGAELFLFPSKYEGFGLPPLQSLSCGVPVVGFSNSSVKEIFAGVAALVPDGNEEKFLKEIIGLLTNKEGYALLSKEGIKFSQRFNWSQIARQYIELLAGL